MMIPVDYVDKYINVPVDMRVCSYWDAKMGLIVSCRINQLDEDTIKNKIVMYPIGKKDKNDREIYTGDIVVVEIDAKEMTFLRRGIIKREGLYAVGIDYIDEDDNLTEDGDFIDEFYISSLEVVGDVFNGMYPIKKSI